MAEEKQISTSIGRYIILAFVGLLFIGAIIGIVNEPEPDYSMVSVSGTLSGFPDISIYTNGQTRSVKLLLKEYPYHIFVIDGDRIKATRYIMMKDYLVAGDSVFLEVLARDFNDTGGHNETQKRTRAVSVYAARSTTQIYLTL